MVTSLQDSSLIGANLLHLTTNSSEMHHGIYETGCDHRLNDFDVDRPNGQAGKQNCPTHVVSMASSCTASGNSPGTKHVNPSLATSNSHEAIFIYDGIQRTKGTILWDVLTVSNTL